MFKRLGLVIDGSKSSLTAGERAIEFAEKCGAFLLIIGVLCASMFLGPEGGPSLRHIRGAATELSGRLRMLENRAREKGVKAEIVLVSSSDIFRELDSLVDKYNLDALIVGLNCCKPIIGLFKNTISLDVITRTKAPVLVIK